MLGRWPPYWQSVQAKYLISIGSKKSPIRRAASIIHQFFLLSWNLWSYCNDWLHGTADILATAKRIDLDTSIAEAISLGSTGMTITTSCHFLCVPILTLSRYSIPLKEQWLSSICLRKKAITAHLQPVAPLFIGGSLYEGTTGAYSAASLGFTFHPPIPIHFKIYVLH